MKLFPSQHLMRFQTGIVIYLVCLLRMFAHEPFDISSRVTVYADRIELSATLGPDGVRQWLANAGRSQKEIAETLRALGPDMSVVHPLSLASGLFEFRSHGLPLTATSVTSISEGMEIIFTITYPRPPAGTMEIRAVCYKTIAGLKNGSLVVSDEAAGQLGAALLSAENVQLSVALGPLTKPIVTAKIDGPQDAPKPEEATSRPSEAPSSRPLPSFSAFFALGVEHILAGIDHLLFLAALLLGIRKVAGMLGVITYFTLAHSVTLGLAALGLVTVSSRVVEPLIALSIIAVCCDNLVRREHEKDRWWLAAGFGLFHGFGFATALQEAGLAQSGVALAIPLLSFNLGVEVGQIAVAAAFLPCLFIIRRWQGWARIGAPAVSACVIAISGYWLVQRLFFI